MVPAIFLWPLLFLSLLHGLLSRVCAGGDGRVRYEETVEYDIAEYTRDRLVWSPERLSKPPVKKDDKYVFSVDTIGGASQVPQKEE